MNKIIFDNVKEIYSENGIQIFIKNSTKFKTNSINLYLRDTLSKERVSFNAMLPAVLKRGNNEFYSMNDISKKLQELYGASFNFSISKKGENQILNFYLECIDNKYASGHENLFQESMEFMFDMICKPLINQNGFKSEYVVQEKENLINAIKSRVNNKMTYSVDRCFEEMYRNSECGIYELGEISYYDEINNINLLEHYNNVISKKPIVVFIHGNVDEDEVIKYIKKVVSVSRKHEKPQKNSDQFEINRDVIEIIDYFDVSQCKLTIGYKTNLEANSSQYYEMLVCNSILGGGMHSKLFQNIRELEGLAYYAFSRYDKFTGSILIGCGIEKENKKKVQEIVGEQINNIKNGIISEFEFESAKKSIISSVKGLEDNQHSIVDFYYGQLISGKQDTTKSLIEKIQSVTISDVIQVSKGIKLDTIYFMAKNNNDN